MTRSVVLIAEELSPATVDALGPDFEIRRCDGSDPEQLLRVRPVAPPDLEVRTEGVDGRGRELLGDEDD